MSQHSAGTDSSAAQLFTCDIVNGRKHVKNWFSIPRRQANLSSMCSKLPRWEISQIENYILSERPRQKSKYDLHNFHLTFFGCVISRAMRRLSWKVDCINLRRKKINVEIEQDWDCSVNKTRFSWIERNFISVSSWTDGILSCAHRIINKSVIFHD